MTDITMTNEQIFLCLLAAAALTVSLLLFLRWVNRRSRASGNAMDEMEGHDFEFFCADLLREAGFEDVEVTRGSGDFGG